MEQIFTELELREMAASVAKSTMKPTEYITLENTKIRTLTTKFKTGFLNLFTETKNVNEKYEETEKYPLDGWILGLYREETECDESNEVGWANRIKRFDYN